MDKIVNFSDAKSKKNKDFNGLAPSFPTQAEVEFFNTESEKIKKTYSNDPGSIPFALYNSKDLKHLWNDIILPIAEMDDIDPWDLAGVMFAKSHGLSFHYDKTGQITGISFPTTEDYS